jgi:2-dehydro-3-deoxygluconokinase
LIFHKEREKMSSSPNVQITQDDLSRFAGKTNVFTTFGEVMIRETPADMERLERTRQVYLSMGGSEYSIAVGLSRLGIPSTYITRVPDNPYGWAVRDIARSQGVNTDHIVWASRTDLIGRMLYEMGRTPRKSTIYYQRKYSAASMLDQGMVDWKTVLDGTQLFHTSGITFGISTHSGYGTNYNHRAFLEAVKSKPADCLIGLDFNYRSTLWTKDQAQSLMADVIGDHVDVLITTIPDMAGLYGIPCGKYSVRQIMDGELDHVEEDDLGRLAQTICRRFNVKMVAITIRYPDSPENQRWESAVMDCEGNFFRSPAIRPIVLLDRLGGGDAWTAGFYYGLLTAGFQMDGMRKGILVGDAATRIKQTLMFDLPMIDRAEISSLMDEDETGGGKQVER